MLFVSTLHTIKHNSVHKLKSGSTYKHNKNWKQMKYNDKDTMEVYSKNIKLPNLQKQHKN